MPRPPATLRVTFYPDHRDPHPTPADLTWPEVGELFASPRLTACAPCPGHSCPAKTGPAWSPADTDYRAKANVKSLSMAVFDLDELPVDRYNELYGRLASEGWAFAVHGTHADGPTRRHLRLVVPLSVPVDGSRWADAYRGAVRVLGLEGLTDPACKDSGRLYFLPSVPPPGYHEHAWHDGDALDVLELPAPNTPAAGPKVPRPGDPTTLDQAKVWLASMGPAVEGQGGDQLTFRVGAYLLNDMALPEYQAFELAYAWNERCRPPWAPDELWKKLRNGARYATRPYGCNRLDQAVVEAVIGDPVDVYGAPLRADEPAPETRWLVRGLVPAGMPQVMAGHPKAMKTLLAEHLSLAVAAGVPWFGQATTRGRVLAVLREDPRPETVRRYRWLAKGFGLDLGDVTDHLTVETDQGFHFDRRGDLERMARTIESRRPDLVILDSLTRMHGQDENSAQAMRAVTVAWAELCAQYGCAVLVIHHLRKAWGDDPPSFGQRMRGTGDLYAMVRHLVGVERPDLLRPRIELYLEGNLTGYPDPFEVFAETDEVHEWTKLVRGGPVAAKRRLADGMADIADGRSP